MNTKEDDSWQGKMNNPTLEEVLVMELNSDILKTIHNLQVELQSFREDSLNERKEQHAISEALLRNMTRGIPQVNPNQSTNISKIEPYHKQASSAREEEKQEHTLETPKGDHHSPSSDDSLSPCRKKQRSNDNLQGEFRKIRAPAYEGEVNIGEKDEEWLLGMSKYFQVHNYSSEMKARLSIYNLNGK